MESPRPLLSLSPAWAPVSRSYRCLRSIFGRKHRYMRLGPNCRPCCRRPVAAKASSTASSDRRASCGLMAGPLNFRTCSGTWPRTGSRNRNWPRSGPRSRHATCSLSSRTSISAPTADQLGPDGVAPRLSGSVATRIATREEAWPTMSAGRPRRPGHVFPGQMPIRPSFGAGHSRCRESRSAAVVDRLPCRERPLMAAQS